MKIYYYLYKLKNYQLIFLGVLLAFTFNVISAIFLDLFHAIDHTIDTEQLQLDIGMIVMMICIGPLVETILFQYFPLRIGKWLKKINKYSYCIIILFSSTVFAIMHPHQIHYFITMLFCGLIFSFICFIFIRKKKHPIIYTAITHAGYNSIIILWRIFYLISLNNKVISFT